MKEMCAYDENAGLKRKWGFLDIETSGLDHKKDQVVEMAYILFEGDQLVRKKQTFVTLRPENSWSVWSEWLTGLKKDDLSKRSDQHISSLDVAKWSLDLSAYDLWAHHARFEKSFLDKIYQDYAVSQNFFRPPYFVDSLSFIQILYPYWKSYSLEELARKCKIRDREDHRAMSDTQDLCLVLMVLLREEKNIYPIEYRRKQEKRLCELFGEESLQVFLYQQDIKFYDAILSQVDREYLEKILHVHTQQCHLNQSSHQEHFFIDTKKLDPIKLPKISSFHQESLNQLLKNESLQVYETRMKQARILKKNLYSLMGVSKYAKVMFDLTWVFCLFSSVENEHGFIYAPSFDEELGEQFSSWMARYLPEEGFFCYQNYSRIKNEWNEWERHKGEDLYKNDEVMWETMWDFIKMKNSLNLKTEDSWKERREVPLYFHREVMPSFLERQDFFKKWGHSFFYNKVRSRCDDCNFSPYCDFLKYKEKELGKKIFFITEKNIHEYASHEKNFKNYHGVIQDFDSFADTMSVEMNVRLCVSDVHINHERILNHQEIKEKFIELMMEKDSLLSKIVSRYDQEFLVENEDDLHQEKLKDFFIWLKKYCSHFKHLEEKLRIDQCHEETKNIEKWLSSVVHSEQTKKNGKNFERVHTILIKPDGQIVMKIKIVDIGRYLAEKIFTDCRSLQILSTHFQKQAQYGQSEDIYRRWMLTESGYKNLPLERQFSSPVQWKKEKSNNHFYVDVQKGISCYSSEFISKLFFVLNSQQSTKHKKVILLFFSKDRKEKFLEFWRGQETTIVDRRHEIFIGGIHKNLTEHMNKSSTAIVILTYYELQKMKGSFQGVDLLCLEKFPDAPRTVYAESKKNYLTTELHGDFIVIDQLMRRKIFKEIVDQCLESKDQDQTVIIFHGRTNDQEFQYLQQDLSPCHFL